MPTTALEGEKLANEHIACPPLARSRVKCPYRNLQVIQGINPAPVIPAKAGIQEILKY
ncbi:hypothetical protein ASZ90_007865 [hydrocarbon metagenome]|uniref:Uncharacterized protein n=1 Tax=hydrocarbon metagenome TaxID=938273 RepID=A0A0W8FN18_9ZZZZ